MVGVRPRDGRVLISARRARDCINLHADVYMSVTVTKIVQLWSWLFKVTEKKEKKKDFNATRRSVKAYARHFNRCTIPNRTFRLRCDATGEF